MYSKKKKSIPEEKRTTSEQSLNKLKSELNIVLTEAEWNSLKNVLNNAVSSDAFRKKNHSGFKPG